jgi:dipeptidyl-peptidase-4
MPAAQAAGQKRPEANLRDGLTVERVSAEPDADDRMPSLRWSPDGARFAWLHWRDAATQKPEELPQREVWGLLSASSEQPSAGALIKDGAYRILSAEVITQAIQGKSEPAKKSLDDDDTNENPYLLCDFAWSKDHGSLLLVGAQAIAWYDLSTGNSRVLTTGDDSISEAQLSPDGKMVSFLRDHKLWLVPVAGGQARLLTPSPAAGILEGEADWTYRNELHMARGYEWSPDSTKIAYLETDDRAVAKYRLQTVDGNTREIAYPKPGGKLPIVRILVRSVVGGPAHAIELGSTKDQYLPRVQWLPDSRHLAIERLDRLQHSLKLLLADASTSTYTTLISETDEYWINLSDILYFFKDGKRFLWSSEKNNFRHLYLYDSSGRELAQVTRGDWEVTRLNSVDEGTSTLYFTATEKSPMERHLYQIHVDGSGLGRVTQQPGTHEVQFAPGDPRPAGLPFVDLYSSHTEQPRLTFTSVNQAVTMTQSAAGQTNGGSASTSPQGNNDSAGQGMTHHDTTPLGEKAPPATGAKPGKPVLKMELPPSLPVTYLPLHLHLGSVTDAMLIQPPNFDPSRKYPVIFYMAGGPGEQFVRDAWGGATGLWMQMMAQKGFVIFALDNHGTAGRGHFFEHPIHLRLGAQELADQRDGLVYLSSLPYVDMSRLGACGWGYGGFMVLHALLDRPVAFKAGFAGAPIADWRLYDATFAERYLEDVVRHQDGWLASMAFDNDSPKFFKGKLMVAQGTDDEFVHLENTFLTQSEMLKGGKSADLLIFPDSGHLIEDPTARTVLFRKMTEFFVSNL